MSKIIPTKTSISGGDYQDWKLHSSCFMPFKYQDEFAENINKIARFISTSNIKDKEEIKLDKQIILFL